jgi:hypothetical protein
MVVVDTGRFAYGSRIPRNQLAKPLALYNLRQNAAQRRTKTMLRNCIIPPSSFSSHSIDDWAAVNILGASKRLEIS